MLTRYHDRAAGSHGLGTQDCTCLEGAAISDGFGTRDRTCLECIRKGLQDLTGKEHQIIKAYEISGPGCRVSRVRDTRSNTPTRYQDGVAGSHGFETPDRTAYEVSERCCNISRTRNTRSYMPTRYTDGAARSHGFGKPDRTCLPTRY